MPQEAEAWFKDSDVEYWRRLAPAVMDSYYVR
jgi:hypothetical protein